MEKTLIVLIVIAGIAAITYYLLLAAERAKTAKLLSELSALRDLPQQLHRLQSESSSVQSFLLEFNPLCKMLHETTEARLLPDILLRMLMEVFQPREAVVLIRRRPTATNPDRAGELIVAAAGPVAADRKGKIVMKGKGELGFAASSGLVMNRGDLDRAQLRGQSSGLRDFEIDLVASMQIGGKTFGALALTQPSQMRAQGKDVLALIAQTGAAKLSSTSAVDQIQDVADRDALTGIANKRVLTYRLGELIYDAETNGGVVSVFLFDIDNFKNYNDVNGHVAGDHLLKSLAKLTAERVRSDDVFGRFGGEEFLIILPGRSGKQARIAAEGIRTAIAEFEFPHREQQPLGCLSISGGIAVFPHHANSSVRLLKVADAALYEAKEAGRNRVLLARPSLIQTVPESAVGGAVEGGQPT